MLYWAVIFLVIALISALFGFGGIVTISAGMAQVSFYIFLAGFLISTLVHVVRAISNHNA